MLLVIALVVLPVGVSSREVVSSHILKPRANGVSLYIDYSNGTTSIYNQVEGRNVLEATESVALVQVDWTGDLAFVYSINGVSSKEETGLWWQYWVNGEFASTAANLCEVQDNDTIMWRFTDSQMQPPTSTQPNDLGQYESLAIASASLGSLGVGFLVALYLMKRRD
jgi:hypothetical protein